MMNRSLIILQKGREHFINKLQHPRSHPPPMYCALARPDALHIVLMFIRWRCAIVYRHYESHREPDMERAEKSTASLWEAPVRKKKS